MSRLSLEVAQKIAIERGGLCLSELYVNNKEHMKWICALGHQWTACLGKIKNAKQWCPTCSGTKKLTIDTAHDVALGRGGKCLSTEYVNCNAPLQWECAESHTWMARLHDVKNGGTWCPYCARVVKLTIEDAHKVAAERGGLCLSNIYINTMTHLKWRCALGHEWMACLSKIKNREQWCPDCGGTKKLTIDVAHDVASERGGKCLSIEYINCDALLQWECSELHKWAASLNNVKNGKSWCPECAGVTKWTIPELNDIAIKNGGRCMSIEYINLDTHLEWICSDNHRWMAMPKSIINGSWCPTCNVSRGERIISEWLTFNNIKFIPQYSFPGSRYSYDYYIPSTNWLIEFGGLQHFKEVPFFHNKVSFEQRQEVDREKTIMAYNNGLSLLRIHYYDILKIHELLQLVTVAAAPHVRCSRIEEYRYLGLTMPLPTIQTRIIPQTQQVKHLTLNVVR